MVKIQIYVSDKEYAKILKVWQNDTNVRIWLRSELKEIIRNKFGEFGV
jgi:phosphorylcholine metabolism protein LicD|tara:strand:+ start:16773 stop:16916 length:144 start_codon:yes stop_codon:yes gene_type:complete